jgi:uncharacterized protein
LNKETADDVINFIKNNIQKEQILILNFHGGEPLLRFDLIKYIINKIRKTISHETMFGITTNGSLLTDEIIEFLSNNMNYNLSLSLDGNKDTQNKNRIQVESNITFETLLKYGKILQLKNDNLRVRMTYDRNNISDIYYNIKYLIDEGFRRIVSEANFFNDDWEEKDFDNIYKQFLKIKEYLYKHKLDSVTIHPINDDFICLSKCCAGHNYYTINAIGDIYPCTMVINDSTHYMGNVRTGIQEEKCEYINKINSKTISSCEKCGHKSHCMSYRCLLINYTTTGSYYSPNLVMCNLMNVKHKLAKSLYNLF